MSLEKTTTTIDDEKTNTLSELNPNGSTPAHGRKGSVVPRSLIISPNLDALLEHEERQRAKTRGIGAEPGTPETYGQPPLSPQRVLPSPEFSTGLPPPPRRRVGESRVPRSPLRETVGSGEEDSVGEEKMSNPYINPAPTLEEVLEMESRDGSKSEAALPWSPSNQREIVQEHAAAKSFAPQNLFRVRSAKGRLAKHKKNTATSSADMQQETWRRRPLISHGQRSSMSSLDTSSTHGPASTLEHEPRISISSTVYPASSAHSHPHSLYNEPVYDITRPSSFMEIISPAHPEFNLAPFSPDGNTDPPLSPIQFSAPTPSLLSFSLDSSPRPPVPTTPKPMFNRPQLRPSPRGSPTRQTYYESEGPADIPLPPTTNFLDVGERADLVRKSRKLARVFGQTPGADAMAQQDSAHPNSSLLPRRKDGASTVDDVQRPRSRLRPRPDAFNLSNHRRHSMPPTPEDVSFLSIVSPRIEPSSPSRDSTKSSDLRRGSSLFLHQASAERASSFYIPSQSIETMSILSVNDRLDDERHRKRERLAKLHRFLGSRVPVNLVLGIDDVESSLPPPQESPTSKPISAEGDESTRKAWLRRRRSRSVTAPPSRWSENLDRVKEELDEEEKALNVRRAQKMEKVFGVAPPLTLYHTRHCPSPSTLPPAKSLPPVPTVSPLINDLLTFSLERDSNPNRSSYTKTKAKKNGRPGTSESNKQLLPKDYENSGYDDRLTTPDARHSLIYTHYQHSLNSLNDILDRDDRESLAELHQYLNSTEAPSPVQPEDDLSTRMDHQLSIASTIKSERRRSLPARTSVISLASSEFTITTPKAEVTTFQVRRRRAAKLTQFFGVNYRELVNDVLESIESGVEHEHQRGTLRAEEVEDLLSRLRNLKTKRQGLF
ncbi:hypothetical protein CPB84DRAFT_1842701 [Gymnopilus junonius]|uniref:Uncharacterized protein n=1 Tax=Gymnopilus junonius TaxID=109634 RepID=A0A9P5NUU2_GYMJU|nr:hypothetical protein CPB84DRAFT_1842701 [Gymnopilus junonius]